MKRRSKTIAVKITAEGPWEGLTGSIDPKAWGEETILVALDTLVLGRDWMLASRDELKLI